MENKGKELPEHEKLCILSFDEIYISQDIEIDRQKEQKIGPHKTVQFGMIRGLFKNWKQPIYYNYDQRLTCDILNETIGTLYDAGYTVVETTTDLGSTISEVWNKFNIGTSDNKHCYFNHPRK